MALLHLKNANLMAANIYMQLGMQLEITSCITLQSRYLLAITGRALLKSVWARVTVCAPLQPRKMGVHQDIYSLIYSLTTRL